MCTSDQNQVLKNSEIDNHPEASGRMTSPHRTRQGEHSQTLVEWLPSHSQVLVECHSRMLVEWLGSHSQVPVEWTPAAAAAAASTGQARGSGRGSSGDQPPLTRGLQTTDRMIKEQSKE